MFVSHSSDEEALARQLVADLEGSGVQCWLASRDVGGSDDYTQQVIRAIDGCSSFVVLMTPAAMRSPHVRRELERAIGDRRPVLPVRVDGVVLDETSAYLLAGCQWVDLSTARPQPGFAAISGILHGGPPGLPFREPPPFYEVLSSRTSDVGIKVRHPGASLALICSCTVVLSPLGLLLGIVYLLTPGRSPEGRIAAGSAVAIGVGGTVLLGVIVAIIITATGEDSAGLMLPTGHPVL